MEITRSMIEDRKAELMRNREMIRSKAEADINAHNGGIENCDWLLAKFDESEATSQINDEGLDQITGPTSRPVKREGK